MAMNLNQLKTDKIIFYGLLVLLVWAPLPLGSNRQWTWALLAVGTYLLSAAYLMLWLQYKVVIPNALQKAKLPILLLFLVQLWVVFQTLPLPSSVIELLSPSASELYRNSIVELSTYPVSVDPHATLNALMKGSTYTLAFILTLLLVNTKQRLKALCYVIIFSGLFQAAYGTVMVLSGQEYSFLVKKWSSMGSAAGTFVSRNNYAGYLNICLAVGTGLLAAQLSKGQSKKWRAHARDWITILLGPKARLRLYLAIMVIGLIMSHSRMGNSAFFIALSVTGLVFILRERQLGKKALLLFASLLLIDALIVGNWFGFKKVAERLEKTVIQEESRVDINRITETIIADYVVTGSGVGSLEGLYPAYTPQQQDRFIERAHNDYYEFLVTFGLLGFLLLAGFMLTVIKTVVVALQKKSKSSSSQTTRNTISYMIIMLLVYLAMHSTVDFNLIIPAFTFTLLCCLALVFTEIDSGLKNSSSALSVEKNRIR